MVNEGRTLTSDGKDEQALNDRLTQQSYGLVHTHPRAAGLAAYATK